MDLRELGWDHSYADTMNETERKEIVPGRVTSHSGKHYKVITEDGEQSATLSNSFLSSIQKKSEIPTIGDWVGLQKHPDIHAYHIRCVFPRKNKLSRKVAGTKSEEQLIASNIDMVFIVTSLDAEFNVRRLERYLAMVYDIQAKPVIVLNKIDKTKDVESYTNKVEKICHNVPIVAISAKEGINIEGISHYIEPGKTIVLIGSSGVGKSTLINQLLGYERQAVGETRTADDKGKHITSTREMIILPEGGILIDNPGIRELQLWISGEGISHLFQDIEELSKSCKFNDCHHDQEPGCAVKQAVERGELSIERLKSYKKLVREQEYLNLRRNRYEQRKKDKQFGKMCRQVNNMRKLRGKR